MDCECGGMVGSRPYRLTFASVNPFVRSFCVLKMVVQSEIFFGSDDRESRQRFADLRSRLIRRYDRRKALLVANQKKPARIVAGLLIALRCRTFRLMQECSNQPRVLSLLKFPKLTKQTLLAGCTAITHHRGRCSTATRWFCCRTAAGWPGHDWS